MQITVVESDACEITAQYSLVASILMLSPILLEVTFDVRFCRSASFDDHVTIAHCVFE